MPAYIDRLWSIRLGVRDAMGQLGHEGNLSVNENYCSVHVRSI